MSMANEGSINNNLKSIKSSRTGGVYIPPFKLSRLQREVEKDYSIEYQRQEWDRLKKRINSIVNKLTSSNVPDLIVELLECNIIRGRGLFARTWIRAQMASPGFTHIYVSFLCIVNSKFPEIGELIIKRILLQFRRAYKRNDRIVCQTCIKCIAHLVNYKIAHEIISLQLLSILLENVTDDSIELAVEFIKDVGNYLLDSCKQGLDAIFDRLKLILQSGNIEKKTQYTIEKLWEIRRDKFINYPSIYDGLDYVDDEDKITHDIDFLDDTITSDEMLNIFKPIEPDVYIKEDEKWNHIKNTLLGITDKKGGGGGGEGSDGGDGDGDTSSDTSIDSDEEEEGEGDGDNNKSIIQDYTDQELINLRKTLYLCIMSSLNYEECVHKLLKLNIPQGYEYEVCNILIDCCSMERTYQLFYSLQAERLCKLKQIYRDGFIECFIKQYKLIHRLDTNKLRNVAKFFTHLLYTNAITWIIFQNIYLTEEDTTSSSRIFIKIIFQELCHHMGINSLHRKLNDPDVIPYINGLFPTNNTKHTRFAINFYTAIGLGAITNQLRQSLNQHVNDNKS